MVSIELPTEYGYIAAVTMATFASATWHSLRTSPFRVKAKVAYPNYFVPHEVIKATEDKEAKLNYYLFNCAQRAHANFLEHYTTFLGALLIAGLQYPVAAASLGAVWNVSRVLYSVGYTSASAKGSDNEGNYTKGSGRMTGSIGSGLSELALLGLAGTVVYNFVCN